MEETQYTPKVLLLNKEQYIQWNETFGSWDNIPDPKGGTLRYATDIPNKDINGFCIMDVTSEKQRQADEKRVILPVMVYPWEVVKDTTNDSQTFDNQIL